MIDLLWLLPMLGAVYWACAGATEEMRERDRFDRELAEIKRRTARGHAPGHDQ
jgi:hypothetical protein